MLVHDDQAWALAYSLLCCPINYVSFANEQTVDELVGFIVFEYEWPDHSGYVFTFTCTHTLWAKASAPSRSMFPLPVCPPNPHPIGGKLKFSIGSSEPRA